MTSIDKLKLLAGLPITMSDFTCSVHPATLMDMAIIGTSKYFQYVNLLTLKDSDVSRMTGQSLDVFSFLTISAKYKELFKEELILALRFFIREDILFIPDLDSFVIGSFEEGRVLSATNFAEFQSILNVQNFVQEDIVKFTGEDDAAKHIKARLEKGRRKVEQIKSQREEDKIELTDLIASLSVNSPLDIERIWRISYYTFNDQFKRMRILEQYNTGLQSIMAGADPKKIKLQDWIRGIQ